MVAKEGRNNSLRVLQEVFCHYGIEKDEMG